MGSPRFPPTRGSLIAAARAGDDESRQVAFGAIVSAYWKPVYKYVRLKWRTETEEAEDLVQGFFATAFEKNFFDRYDPSRAKFRTYLRTCVDGFVSNARKAERRLKRGGGAPALSLDFASAEGELRSLDPADPGADMDDVFHREWVRHLFSEAVETLRAFCVERGKPVPFEIFRAYDLDADDGGARPSYAELAVRHGVPVTQVTNYLSWARGEFRKAVLDSLQRITGSDAEYRAEARTLLGIDVK
jgi:RNA polymerase sigma factor (sigma-70 family)